MKESQHKINTRFPTPCGLDCGPCEYRGKICKGCAASGGMPFWAKDKPCPIYDCAVNSKHLKHCGKCSELPCIQFLSLRDPSLSDEEFEKQIRDRQRRLERRS